MRSSSALTGPVLPSASIVNWSRVTGNTGNQSNRVALKRIKANGIGKIIFLRPTALAMRSRMFRQERISGPASSNRKSVQPWMFIYIGLAAAIVLAGRPADVTVQDSMLPVPAIVGSAPLFRKDI